MRNKFIVTKYEPKSFRVEVLSAHLPTVADCDHIVATIAWRYNPCYCWVKSVSEKEVGFSLSGSGVLTPEYYSCQSYAIKPVLKLRNDVDIHIFDIIEFGGHPFMIVNKNDDEASAFCMESIGEMRYSNEDKDFSDYTPIKRRIDTWFKHSVESAENITRFLDEVNGE